MNNQLNKLVKPQYSFLLLIIAALIILQIPIISIPFKWLESYFHEISHGLAALATGGQIVKIELFTNGAGLCTTRGGSRLLVSFFGYAGATIWGCIFYFIVSRHQLLAKGFLSLLIGLLAATIIFWVRDVLTALIIGCLIVLLIVKFRFVQSKYLTLLLQLTAMMVVLNSLQSPWYLLDGRSIGDGSTLAELTYIPEIVWVFTWCLLAIFGIVGLSRLNAH